MSGENTSLDRGVRLLMTDRCNLRCVFCHNEFQGGGRSPGSFQAKLVLELLDQASSDAESLTVKLSGGEPLLDVAEALRLTHLVASHGKVQRVVLISNLQRRLTPAQFRAFADAGLREVRANIPSFKAETYRSRVGGGVRLERVLGQLEAFHRVGMTLEATVVLEAADGAAALRIIERELLLARTGGLEFSRIRFARDAYSGRLLVDWSADLAAGGFAPIDERRWERQGRPRVVVASCDDWTAGPPPGSDWYVQPPGYRLTSFVPSRALSVAGDAGAGE